MKQINGERMGIRHIVFDHHIELQIVSNLHEHQWVIHIYQLNVVHEFLF